MKKSVSIFIGDFHASRHPTVIKTILGSCVAVCLYDPFNRIGGMNHILLPGKADMKHFNDRARYGIHAMELLINKMMNLGANRNRLVAKIFGGAHVIPSISADFGMGKKNAEFVINFCRIEDIKIVSQEVGGHESRKIHFHTDTGDVFLKRFGSLQTKALIFKEKSKLKRLGDVLDIQGDVTLFKNE